MTRWIVTALLIIMIGSPALLYPGIGRSQSITDNKHIRIIYTNDILGYLEPCGCGGRYEGGFARLNTVVSNLSRENTDCLVIDSGNVCDTRTKMGIVATLMSRMNYGAIGVGKSDLALAEDFFKQTVDAKLTIVDAVCRDQNSSIPYLIKQVGALRVGVVSYGVNYVRDGASWESRLSFTKAYETARKGSDILILLDQGGIATQQWIEKDADGLGAPDIVVGGTAGNTSTSDLVIGRTHLVPTSSQSKRVGVVDIEATGDRQYIMTVRTVPVDKNTVEDASVKKLITEFVLKQAESSPRRNDYAGSSGRDSKQRVNIPSLTCKKCHSDEYQDWAKSKHASAIDTIVSKDRLVPECLACHSEQFRRTSKISLRSSTKDPSGVECASCHISVLPHGIEGPSKGSSAKVDPKLCLDCHNAERSPNYDEKSYVPRMTHNTLSSK